ncbi:hypothetical protein B4Q13_15030 [Lacticaseibacillus rhamnosus]
MSLSSARSRAATSRERVAASGEQVAERRAGEPDPLAQRPQVDATEALARRGGRAGFGRRVERARRAPAGDDAESRSAGAGGRNRRRAAHHHARARLQTAI